MESSAIEEKDLELNNIYNALIEYEIDEVLETYGYTGISVKYNGIKGRFLGLENGTPVMAIEQEYWHIVPQCRTRDRTDKFLYTWYGEKNHLRRVNFITPTNETQKVRGIRFLEALRISIAPLFIGHSQFCVFPLNTEEEAVKRVKHMLSFWKTLQKESMLFARPCPEVACHGFLESRRVMLSHRSIPSVYSELKKLHKEVLQTDPKGQLLLMPYMKAAYNMVLANGTVTIGAYHDGATANRKSISIPTADIVLDEYVQKAAGITDSPFIELVSQKHEDNNSITSSFVQLRNGPFIPRCKDYLPETVKVKRIVAVAPTTDMVTFRKDAAKFDAGTVVYGMYGASINSHAGIHCFENNVPFIVSREPVIGEKWEKNADTKKPCDVASFTNGVNLAFSTKISLIDEPGSITSGNVIEAMLFVLHSVPFFDLSEAIQARLLGFACGIGVRFGAVACIGEARYGQPSTKSETVLKVHVSDRSTVYEKTFSSNIVDAIKKLNDVTLHFSWPGWGTVGGGVGGPKWHICGLTVLKLWNAICYFINDGDNEKACIEALNNVVNVSHNGSLLLTKFTAIDMFQAASTWKLPFLAATAVNVLYRCGVNRLPLSTKESNFFMPVNLEPLMPKREMLLKHVESILPITLKLSQLERLIETYNGYGDFSGLDKELEERLAEMQLNREQIYEVFRTKYSQKIPWKSTEGCNNCQTSPFPGSYVEWYEKEKRITLDPCAGCNLVSFHKPHETLIIADDLVPQLYECRHLESEKVLSIQKKINSCNEMCDDCGLCLTQDDCNCKLNVCDCKIECSKCLQSYDKTDDYTGHSHSCQPPACEECGFAIMSNKHVCGFQPTENNDD